VAYVADIDAAGIDRRLELIRRTWLLLQRALPAQASMYAAEVSAGAPYGGRVGQSVRLALLSANAVFNEGTF
jgi:hypothetical protein